MTPDTFKNKVISALAPFQANLHRRDDKFEVVVNLPNGCTVAGKIAISDDFDFADLNAQCKQADASDRSDTLFMLKCANIEEMYSLDKTYKHLVVPEGVESIGWSTFYGFEKMETVTLPSTLTIIDSCAFENCTSLKRVEIPAGVKTLKNDVFRGCKSLEDVKFPEGLTSIGHSCFADCTSLQSIDLPDSVISIGGDPKDNRGRNAFVGCISLNSVKLPKGIEWLGVHPFGGSKGLSSLSFETDRFVMRDSMLIDKETHTLLTLFETPEAVIPEGIIAIGREAAQGLATLESITFPSTLREIGASAFWGFSTSSTPNKLKTITIPDGVTEIGDMAFEGCYDLESVTLPQTLRTIERRLFSKCPKLSDIKLPDTMSAIKSDAFSGCTSLTEMKVPDGVTVIEYRAFEESGIRGIKLPDTLTTIGDYAFHNSQIEEVEIPASVTEVGESAFEGCKALHTVTFAAPTVYLGLQAFENCEALTTVNLPPKGLTWNKLKSRFRGSPWGMTPPPKEAEKRAKAAKIDKMREVSLEAMARGTFAPHDTEVVRANDKELGDTLTIKVSLSNGCCICGIYKVDSKKGYEQIDWEKVKAVKTQAEQSPEGTAFLIGNVAKIKMNSLFDPAKVKHMVYTDGIDFIAYGSVAGFAQLQSVVMSSSVTGIGAQAFSKCIALTDIMLPQSITELKYRTFEGCKLLRTINIPNGVTTIEYNAFDGCASLEEVVVPDSVTDINKEAFANCVSLRKLTLPSDDELTVFPDIINGCDPKILTIESERFALVDGLFVDYKCHYINDFCFESKRLAESRRIAMHYIGDADTVVVPDGIQGIAENCFSGKEAGAEMRRVELPATLEVIGDWAFYNCKNLESVHIPESVKKIYESAFYGCSALAKVDLPDKLSEIDSRMFQCCESLKEIILPAALKVIGWASFDKCAALESVTIPEGVEIIKSSAFEGCVSLKKVRVPANVGKIEERAFKDCTSLECVEIAGATEIGENVFTGCTALKHIIIGSAEIKTVPASFSGCTAVTEVDLAAGLTWSKIKGRFKDSPWSQAKPTKK